MGEKKREERKFPIKEWEKKKREERKFPIKECEKVKKKKKERMWLLCFELTHSYKYFVFRNSNMLSMVFKIKTH